MARCPDCNKFVGIEQEAPEVQSLEISGEEDTATITCEVSLALNCADCSTQLSEATAEHEEEIEVKHDLPDCKGAWEIEEVGCGETDRFEGKGRGARHYYGAEVTAKVTCPECKANYEVSFTVEEQASSFDSVV